jgi:uncharacterized protein YcfJ
MVMELHLPKHRRSNPRTGATMKSNTLAIALASLLVGGVAVAAFQSSRDHSLATATPAAALTTPDQAALAAADAGTDASIPAAAQAEYADVVDVDPITEKQKLYAQVIGTEPVRETSTVSTPHEECNDVAVQEQAPAAIRATSVAPSLAP